MSKIIWKISSDHWYFYLDLTIDSNHTAKDNNLVISNDVLKEVSPITETIDSNTHLNRPS